MDILFGLETEYGISRRDPSDDLDVVAESIAIVRACTAPGVRLRWDYAREDPHLDARGFRVAELRQDSDESRYFARDAARPMAWHEIKSDYVLRNGARFYNDHAHPEYSTPECRSPLEIVRQDHAGDDLLRACTRAINAADPDASPVVIFKNNTDFHGHSYGCHENYLVPRSLPWNTLAAGTLPFLVTRQVFAGAGKYGREEEDRFAGPGFQLSQRADFFSELQSVDTMQRRPLVNTRDEPHADPAAWRRFHVIIGDANLCPWATWLKVGSTALLLQALTHAGSTSGLPELADPLASVRAVSRDTTLTRPLPLLGRSPAASAIEIQRACLAFVERHLPTPDPLWSAVLSGWSDTLDALAAGSPESLAGRLDWATKHHLIETLRSADPFDAGDILERSLDLAYSDLDPDLSLFTGWQASGALTLPPGLAPHTPDSSRLPPPPDTRAAIRGACVERFGPAVTAANWEEITLRDPAGTSITLDLRRLFSPEAITSALTTITSASRPADLRSLPFARS